MSVFVRSAFNYDREEVSRKTGLACEDESKAVQSAKDDADINVIVRRFGLTGKVPVDVRTPLSLDFVDVTDFKTAMNALRDAQESFAAMPSDVRKRFSNDPGLFYEFCTEVKDGRLANLDEMRKFGLAIPKAAVPEPVTPPSS